MGTRPKLILKESLRSIRTHSGIMDKMLMGFETSLPPNFACTVTLIHIISRSSLFLISTLNKVPIIHYESNMYFMSRMSMKSTRERSLSAFQVLRNAIFPCKPLAWEVGPNRVVVTFLYKKSILFKTGRFAPSIVATYNCMTKQRTKFGKHLKSS